MSPTLLLVVYCVLILLASLVGGWIPMLVRLTHKRMEVAVSFVAGVMLGVGVLHMLPHALQLQLEGFDLQSLSSAVEHGHEHGHDHDHAVDSHALAHGLFNPVMLWLLAGFLVMFFIERFFCFHHHDAPDDSNGGDRGCTHDHGHGEPGVHRHALTWTGTAVGLSLHSLIEGVALAASVEAARNIVAHDHGEASVAAIAGIGTFLVILLHKPFDSLTLATMMTLGRRSMRMRHLVNAGFSLLIVAGVLLFHIGVMSGGDRSGIISAALAFSAGTFLCIAMSDLLPELQFHQHDRGKLSAALVLGLALAWILGVLESRIH